MTDEMLVAIIAVCYTVYACWNRYLSHKEKVK